MKNFKIKMIVEFDMLAESKEDVKEFCESVLDMHIECAAGVDDDTIKTNITVA